MTLCEGCQEEIDEGWELDGKVWCDECFEELKTDPRYAGQVEEVIEDQVVEQPDHYTQHPSGIECIDIVQNMDFCLGNAFKYLFRRDLKSTRRVNLKKAKYYVRRRIIGAVEALPGGSPVSSVRSRSGPVRKRAVAPVGPQRRALGSDASPKAEVSSDAGAASDGLGDVLGTPAEFGAGCSVSERGEDGLSAVQSLLRDPKGADDALGRGQAQAEVRRIAHVYQSEEDGYRQAMLLIWAVARPKEALHLVQEVLSGLR